MDHVAILLGAGHATAADHLVREACAAGGLVCPRPSRRHVTLASFEALTPAVVRDVVEAVAARTAPFHVHAHGYGLFAGAEPTDLNLHVPVIRSPVLESLRSDLHAALAGAGAALASWVGPGEWSPHITLIDGPVSADPLARVVAQLLRRHHPSWHIPVDALAVAGSRGSGQRWISVPLPAGG